MIAVLGLLRYVFLALLVLFVVYVLGLIRKDLS